MIRMESEHCQIVDQSLNGKRAVDEQTFASLEILSERLERLKKLDGIFEKIEFSPDAKRLKTQKDMAFIH